jgi:hypothetical protein
VFARVLILLGIATAGGALWAGLDYYALPLTQRPFSPLHDLYAPSGLVGQGLGIIGTLMILVGVLLYSLRKRVRALARFGKLKHWLELHIFLCLLGPFLVLLHTTFKFGGLVAISFWSMMIVVASGVFGRWVYVWIPKTVNGRFLSIHEIQEDIRTALERMRDRTSLPPERIAELLGDVPARAAPGGIGSAVVRSVGYRVRRRGERSRAARKLSAVGVAEPVRSQIIAALDDQRRARQQMLLMQPFQRAFRYWHAFHLPLAAVMLLVLLVHVAVSVAFGYTWIF